MTEATINSSILMGLGPNCEVYNCEIANANTLTTGFHTIVAVVATSEETQAATTAWGYTVSGGQITFTVSSTMTYGVVVFGLK